MVVSSEYRLIAFIHNMKLLGNWLSVGEVNKEKIEKLMRSMNQKCTPVCEDNVMSSQK